MASAALATPRVCRDDYDLPDHALVAWMSKKDQATELVADVIMANQLFLKGRCPATQLLKVGNLVLSQLDAWAWEAAEEQKAAPSLGNGLLHSFLLTQGYRVDFAMGAARDARGEA